MSPGFTSVVYSLWFRPPYFRLGHSATLLLLVAAGYQGFPQSLVNLPRVGAATLHAACIQLPLFDLKA